MQTAAFLLGSLLVSLAAADDRRPAAPLGTPPLVESTMPVDESAPLDGVPGNRWRYRYYTGRWWYWLPENRWSYFDGVRWRTYHRAISREHVDPALLRPESIEGVLRPRNASTPRRGGGTSAGGGAGGTMSMSGTQGSVGGAPSGSFTNPVGVPSAVNTSTGTSTDVSGLNGRASGTSNPGTGNARGR
ncbi:MAG TPA: hypothetical protein VHC22_11995 [Pirellulales bacterium]|nr:hypothetical protein [Pirellulales bacterium]